MIISDEEYDRRPPPIKTNPPEGGFKFDKYPELDRANIDLLLSGGSNLDTYGSQLMGGLDTFKTSFKLESGRDATADEVNGYLKNSLFGAWNTPGELLYTDFTNLANNYISNNFDVEQLRRDKGKADAPGQYDAVDQQIQSILGRGASEQEKEHFGTLIANGTMDAYQFQEFLKQQPEYTTKQDETFRAGISGQLASSDTKQFQSNILPGIQEAYAKQGRSFDSSGFQNAATQSAQQQNVERERYLATLSASQYGSRQDQAYNDYASAVANQRGVDNYTRQLRDQSSIAGTNRLYEQQDYNTQANAYNQYLSKYGKRNNGMSGAIGGAASGAAIGGSFGAGWGAIPGAVVGGVSGYFGSRGGNY